MEKDMNWYRLAILETVPKEDMALLLKIVKKITIGNRKWTPKELQIQQNYPELLEKLLKKEMVSA